jgi:hypothetical protein
MMVYRGAERAKARAETIFPKEAWSHSVDGICVGEHLFIADSRQPKNNAQRQILRKEINQGKLLVEMGKTVYLVPEQGEQGQKLYDAIVDGYLTEFKWVTGNRNAIGDNFNNALKKFEDSGEHQYGDVFLVIENLIVTQRSVQAILACQLKKGKRYSGRVLCSVEQTHEVYEWSIANLGKK